MGEMGNNELMWDAGIFELQDTWLILPALQLTS